MSLLQNGHGHNRQVQRWSEGEQRAEGLDTYEQSSYTGTCKKFCTNEEKHQILNTKSGSEGTKGLMEKDLLFLL